MTERQTADRQRDRQTDRIAMAKTHHSSIAVVARKKLKGIENSKLKRTFPRAGVINGQSFSWKCQRSERAFYVDYLSRHNNSSILMQVVSITLVLTYRNIASPNVLWPLYVVFHHLSAVSVPPSIARRRVGNSGTSDVDCGPGGKCLSWRPRTHYRHLYSASEL